MAAREIQVRSEPPQGSERKYSSAELSLALRQGEILSNVVQWLGDASKDPPEVVAVEHPYAVVASQDCDLAQDYSERVSPKNPQQPKKHLFLSSVLLLPGYPPATVAETLNRDMRTIIARHKDPRFQLLQAAEPCDDLKGHGLPELVVDMKQFFAVPRDDLYRQLLAEGESAARRTRLISPYRDHLQVKFAAFLGRVGLPEDHLSD